MIPTFTPSVTPILLVSEDDQQSLGDGEEEQASPNIAADRLADSTVYQHLRELTKRAARMF
jgi:hypothetical protein